MLVDDGLATGSSMRAAIGAIRAYQPAKIIVAIPVAPRKSANSFDRWSTTWCASMTPEPFYAVGLWYDDFSPYPTETFVSFSHEPPRPESTPVTLHPDAERV